MNGRSTAIHNCMYSLDNIILFKSNANVYLVAIEQSTIAIPLYYFGCLNLVQRITDKGQGWSDYIHKYMEILQLDLSTK